MKENTMADSRCPDPPYGEHLDSAAIRKAGFNGYQGKAPDDARVLVLGLDANWPCGMLDPANIAFWEEVKLYLGNPVDYWKKGKGTPCYPATCKVPIHHPLISAPRKTLGGKWPQYGTKYHHTFNTKLKLPACHADCLTFVEMLVMPTYGSTTKKGGLPIFKKMLLSTVNDPYVHNLNNWLFNPAMRDFRLVLLSTAVLENGIRVLARAKRMPDPMVPPAKHFIIKVPGHSGSLELFIINDKTLWCRHTHFSAQSGAIAKEASLLQSLIAAFCNTCPQDAIGKWFPQGITEDGVRKLLGSA